MHTCQQPNSPTSTDIGVPVNYVEEQEVSGGGTKHSDSSEECGAAVDAVVWENSVTQIRDQITITTPHTCHQPNSPTSVGMGTLANPAEGQRFDEGGAKCSNKSGEWGAAMDVIIWENLVTQIRDQLRSMTSDECYSRALELQMVACSELNSRGHRLSNDKGLLVIDQSILHRPPADCRSSTTPDNNFVPISPMRSSSERSYDDDKPAKHRDWQLRGTSAITKASSTEHHPDLPISQEGIAVSSILSTPTKMYTCGQKGTKPSPTHALDSFQLDIESDDSDSNWQCMPVTVRPAIRGTKRNTARVASRWSDIQAMKQQKETRGKGKRASTGIAYPSELDVLSGRGGHTNRHEGNLLFRDEARKLRGVFQHRSTSRIEKIRMSWELVKVVKEYGGRFLDQNDDRLWYEMDDKDSRKKAAQALRENKWKR